MGERLAATDLDRAEAMSLLAWWVESGVDVALQDDPRDWRSSAPAVRSSTQDEPDPVAAAPVPPAPTLSPPAPSRPQTLEDFHRWLETSADLPLFRAGAARALPHGPAEAELMLLAGLPSAEDAAAGRPIAGAAWELTERMLGAIGVGPAGAYVAALTCFSSIGTRFASHETDACRETVLAQIALAAPRRLLLLGDAPAKLLLGQPMASARGRMHRVAGIPTVATFAPRHLLSHSHHKAHAWADLLLIMGDH